jgi:hypothetical protein
MFRAAKKQENMIPLEEKNQPIQTAKNEKRYN